MKIKRILAIVLSLISILSMSLISGCGKTNSNSASESVKEEENSSSKSVVLSDFEEFNPDFQLLRLQNGFGRIDVNKDEAFVKSGKQSATLRPLGRYKDKAKPFFYFELESELYEYSYSDLKYLYSATMWIYNAQSEVKNVEVGLVTYLSSVRDDDGAKQAGGFNYKLKEGWNKLTYFVERDSIKIPAGGTKVKGLYVQFDNVPSKDIEDAPIYYIDDVSLLLMTKYRDIEVTTPYYSPLQGDVVKVPTATIEDGEVNYTVVHDGKTVPVSNGEFIPNAGGKFEIIYNAIVDGFVFKKTISIFVKPSNAVEVMSFDDANSVSDVTFSGHVDSVEWVSEFNGESGVAKVDMNRDWPAVHFKPKFDKSMYENCEYIVVRAYFVGGQNQMRYIRLCDNAYPEEYGERVEIDHWISYKFPIQIFLERFNNPWIVGNTTDYQVNGLFYIAEIYAM